MPAFLNLNKKIACICAVLLGFTLPISTGLDSLLLALLLISALIGWNTQYLSMIKENAVAKTAILLFSVLIFGCFYGPQKLSDGFKILTKYDDLIIVALALPIFSQFKLRSYALNAFMIAMTLTMLLSFLIWFGAFENTRFFPLRSADNPVVFKLHITHGILMAFACFLFAIKALNIEHKWRKAYLALSMLAAFNVLFMVQGRTGYVIFAALSIFLTVHLLRKNFNFKSIALVAIGIITLICVGYFSSAKLQNRLELAKTEYEQWQPTKGSNETSSIGTRMDFYTNTLKIISKNPLFGVGTGGFEQAYKKEIIGTAYAPAVNPHNQFLLFGAQIGIIGLCAFILLLVTEWRNATKLENEYYLVARGLVITIVVGSLFNSLLLDHSEGLFFAWTSALAFAGLQNKPSSNITSV